MLSDEIEKENFNKKKNPKQNKWYSKEQGPNLT
jgi:hypothetical protein